MSNEVKIIHLFIVNRPEISTINTARPLQISDLPKTYPNKIYKGIKCYQFNMKLE